jgi:uncharacterized membrane protein YdbT with pleckstrin-like domain
MKHFFAFFGNASNSCAFFHAKTAPVFFALIDILQDIHHFAFSIQENALRVNRAVFVDEKSSGWFGLAFLAIVWPV